MKTLTPNIAVVATVGFFVLYWVLALVFPAAILRDVFNAVAFGTAVVIVFTWLPAALKAIRQNAETGEWQLILAIFVIWSVVVFNRLYVGLFNFAGRPESWTQSPITGFWPYSFMVAGFLFISAPGVHSEGFRTRAMWSLVVAVAIGALLAGIMIGTGVSEWMEMPRSVRPP
ncbi:MAG: hypothetical protein AB7I52_03600 [Rhizobiaceae bacterium]